MRRAFLLSVVFTVGLHSGAVAKDDFGLDDKREKNSSSFPSELQQYRKSVAPKDPSEVNTKDNPPLDIVKSDPAVHVALSKKYTAQKKYKEALIEVNRALLCNKDDWEARYQGALILQLTGRNKEAIDRYKAYLVVKPENIQAHLNLGVLLKQEGEVQLAEDEYKKAIELHYYSLQPHYNLANLYIEERKYEDALRELKVCVKLQPSNAWVHNNMGVVFQHREYLEEAEEEFLRALTLEPANKIFENNLFIVRTKLHKKTVKA